MRWRFTLIDYTFNPAGVVTVLPDEPVGWDDMEIKIVRDKNWHGVFFDYSFNKLGFIGDAYAIIKAAYDDSGSQASTDILIEAACSDTDAFDEFYRGRLVYARIKFSQQDYCIVEVPVEQTGCLTTFRSRYEQTVSLLSRRTFGLPSSQSDNLPDYSSKFPTITLPPKDIILINQGAQSAETNELIFTTGEVRNNGFRYYEEIINDFNSFAPKDNYLDTGTPPAGLPILIIDSLDDIECGNNSVNIRIDLDLDVSYDYPAGWSPGSPVDVAVQIILSHRDSSGAIISTGILYSASHVPPFTHNISIHSDYPFTVNVGDQFYFYIRYGVSIVNPPGDDFIITENYTTRRLFKATRISTCPASTSRVFLIQEALSRTAEIISDDCLRVKSDYFGRTDSLPSLYAPASDGCGSLESITNGLYIRNASKTDGSPPELFVSMKQLFDGLNAIHNIGMGLEDDTTRAGFNMLRIEPVRYFYKSNIILTLTDVKEVNRSYDISRAIASVVIGYKQWESDYNGGRDEFLTKREYRTELNQVQTRLEKLSDLIASGYAIEVTRRQGASMNDFKYDNELFIICLARDSGNFIVETFGDGVISNLVTVNVLGSGLNLYNVRISPRRNMLRWYKSVRTVKSSRLQFNAGEGNYIAKIRVAFVIDACLLEVQSSGSDMSENGTVSSNHFKNTSDATPIWLPETIEFEYPLSYQEFKTIKADPTATILLTHQGEALKGFIEEISYNPNEGIAKFKLLRSWS